MSYQTLPAIPPDFSSEPQPVANVDVVQFGDGYSQRRPAGINYKRTDWAVSWTLLERDEYDTLYEFLNARLKLTPFWWTPPWETQPRRYICTELSGPRPTSARHADITAAFEEDLNP